MPETKYFRDMNHNYLIIKGSDKLKLSPYHMRMITENDINGLLKVSQRYIDGEENLYYEINSMQTLKQIFEHRKMDKSSAFCLLSGLVKILGEIKNYLLNDAGLLLNQEHIFLNWEKQEVKFVFYPYINEPIENQIKQLFEYLVRIIDHSDEHLVDVIYDLCQLAERKVLNAEKLDYYLSDLTCPKTIESDCDVVIDNHEITKPEYQENIASLVDKTPDEVNENKINEKKQRWKFLILSVISAAGAIFTAIYQWLFNLTGREIVLSWILLIVFILFLLMTGGIYLLLVCRSVNKNESTVDSYHVPSVTKQATEYCGDTVFLSDDIAENKLYGIGKGSKLIIDMNFFPFIIGKLDDNTDFCIKEASISRIHVKFTKYDNTVFMTDLNSTNGTYKNGLRLEPSETVPIEAGDEIRLGKLNFCFR